MIVSLDTAEFGGYVGHHPDDEFLRLGLGATLSDPPGVCWGRGAEP